MDTDMDGGSGAAAGVSAGATTTSDEVIAQQLQVNLQLTSHRITPRLVASHASSCPLFPSLAEPI